MSKWIVRFQGGIGNQLFIYTFAKYLHYRYNHDILCDFISYRRSNIRKPEIFLLDDALFIHDVELNDVCFHGVSRVIMSILMKINPFVSYVREIEDESTFDKLVGTKFNLFYIGYYQTSKYLHWLNENNLHTLLFEPKQQIPSVLLDIYQLIKRQNISISIHVRRGDYTSGWAKDKYLVCTPKYYNEAIRLCNEKDAVFFIFSDDIDWVKNNINVPVNSIFVPNYNINSFWYIYLMSKCKYNIISNSTFSWWGAQLNCNSDKIVIAPSLWLRGSCFSLNQEGWSILDVE